MSSAMVSVPGKSPLWATDFLPFTTLMYGNGPGHKKVNGSRPDIRNVDTSKALRPESEHQQSAIVSELHHFRLG